MQESLKTLIQLTGLAISVAPVLYAKQMRFNVNESTGKITIPAPSRHRSGPCDLMRERGTTGLGTHGIRSVQEGIHAQETTLDTSSYPVSRRQTFIRYLLRVEDLSWARDAGW